MLRRSTPHRRGRQRLLHQHQRILDLNTQRTRRLIRRRTTLRNIQNSPSNSHIRKPTTSSPRRCLPGPSAIRRIILLDPARDRPTRRIIPVQRRIFPEQPRLHLDHRQPHSSLGSDKHRFTKHVNAELRTQLRCDNQRSVRPATSSHATAWTIPPRPGSRRQATSPPQANYPKTASQDTTHSAHQTESPAGETTQQQSPTAPETSGSETNTSPICLALSTRTGTPSSHKLPRRTKQRSHLLQTPTFLGILFREQLPKDSSTLQMSSQRRDWRESLHANPSKRGNNVGPRSFCWVLGRNGVSGVQQAIVSATIFLPPLRLYLDMILEGSCRT